LGLAVVGVGEVDGGVGDVVQGLAIGMPDLVAPVAGPHPDRSLPNGRPDHPGRRGARLVTAIEGGLEFSMSGVPAVGAYRLVLA
jgi:hypothetical protein